MSQVSRCTFNVSISLTLYENAAGDMHTCILIIWHHMSTKKLKYYGNLGQKMDPKPTIIIQTRRVGSMHKMFNTGLISSLKYIEISDYLSSHLSIHIIKMCIKNIFILLPSTEQYPFNSIILAMAFIHPTKVT